MRKEPKSVGVFGATGFIGRALVERLTERGWRVVGFSRRPPGGTDWRAVGGCPNLEGLEAVVNLAGESIAQRWNKAAWKQIRESRVDLTSSIVEAMGELEPGRRPKALLNASAVGIYAPGGDRELPESEPPGSGRLERLCQDWEAAALEAEKLGVRVVRLRTGIVIGEGGEAWGRLRKLFTRGFGGRLGSGRQWMPWIHLGDEVAAIVMALENESVSGPLNLCAPEPVTNAEFTRHLAEALGRPAFFHAPGVALRLVLGGFGETLLASSRTVPARLLELGFEFRFPTLEKALADLLEKREGGGKV